MTETTHGPRILADLLGDLEAEAERARTQHQTGVAPNPATGLAPIDRALGGYLAEGLHILHGAPGTGKTALVLQIAATCGSAALFLTAEMPPTELLRRIIARVTGVFLGRLKSGELDVEHILTLAHRTIETAPYLAILDATMGPSPNVATLQLAVESVRNRVTRIADATATATAAPCQASGRLRQNCAKTGKNCQTQTQTSPKTRHRPVRAQLRSHGCVTFLASHDGAQTATNLPKLRHSTDHRGRFLPHLRAVSFSLNTTVR